MSIANFGDLKGSLANWLNRANLSARIPDFVTLAETRIAYGSMDGQLSCEPVRIRGMETSADVAITGQTAALPTGYLAPRRFYLNTDPVTKLTYIAPDLFWETYIGSTSGKPTRYTVEGDNFVFGPIPDSNYTAKILYYQKFPALSDDADTNWLLTNAPGVYLHGALTEAYAFVRNSEKAIEEHSAFCGLVNALNTADKSDRYSGPWQTLGDTGNP